MTLRRACASLPPFFSPARMPSRARSGSPRAVATIGARVVCRMCWVSARPMPREAGATSVHGLDGGIAVAEVVAG